MSVLRKVTWKAVFGQAERMVPGLFFIAMILVGICVFKDYSVSWDESTSRKNGMISLVHVIESTGLNILKQDQILKEFNTPLSEYADRDYGVAFELPLAFAERVLGLNDTRSQYLFRHLITYLIFVLGLYAVYCLAKRRFGSWHWGVIAATMLALSPRFFAEGFYNSKDIVFMVFFAIAMNTLIIFIQKPSYKNSLLHALATAMAIDVRVMGITLPIITFGMFGFHLLRGKIHFKDEGRYLFIYMAATVILTILMWPWLWDSPLGHFREALHKMSHFRWHEFNFYNGSYIPASKIPWHYIPTWIVVTTPILYLFLFLIGNISTVGHIITKRKLVSDFKSSQDELFFAIFNGAILSVIVLHSVLYDGWRQLYFIYPAFIMLAIKGMHILWQRSAKILYFKILLIVAIFISSLQTAKWMINVHPLQNIYFNHLSGNWKSKFDMDYWGMSNRQAIEYILKNDNREIIKIWPVSNTPSMNGTYVLPELDRNRIVLASNKQDADYLINNYRFLKGDVYKEEDISFKNFYEILIDHHAIISVFKKQN